VRWCSAALEFSCEVRTGCADGFEEENLESIRNSLGKKHGKESGDGFPSPL